MPKAKKNKAKSTTSALKTADKAQYETERMFAAENVTKRMLEEDGYVFADDQNEDDVGMGSFELNGVDDARDGEGRGGAWVCIRFYIPNLDIDTEIDS